MANYYCADAGSENCPCVLAEDDQCYQCGKLAGGDCNECLWTGVCIYSRYLEEGKEHTGNRSEMVYKILHEKNYGQDCKVLILKTDKGMAQQCSRPGSFLFLRREDLGREYDMPVSVLKAIPNEEQIHVAIGRAGVKSKPFWNLKQRRLKVRGIYRSGIEGLSELKKECKETVIFAKGVATAPIVNILSGYKEELGLQKIKVYIDTAGINMDFIKEYFGFLPIETIKIMDFKEDMEQLKIMVSNEKAKGNNIMVMTSPYYISQLGKIGKKIIRPNNYNMCCGEGICGACSYTDMKGVTVRKCKVIDK